MRIKLEITVETDPKLYGMTRAEAKFLFMNEITEAVSLLQEGYLQDLQEEVSSYSLDYPFRNRKENQ